MLHPADFPIMEFDDNPVAKLNPSHFAGDTPIAERLVITFFPEVMKRLEEEGAIVPAFTINGENPVYVFRFADCDTLIIQGQVGCPACGGNLDLLNAMGVRKVMFCGGGGVLDPNIGVGQLLLVEGAIRDEGFSYHYLPAGRVVEADPAVRERIAAYLERRGISYLTGLVWTTDAIFRETADRIALRRQEGAKIVEMEQAGCLAVAKHRGFDYGALIYGGDDCASEEWNDRCWSSRRGVRYELVQLCREIVQEM